MELTRGAMYNVGFGLPDGIPQVALEEGIFDAVTCSIEQGGIGGFPALGGEFGAMHYAQAFVQHHEQFDFYHGGGLDMAFLGLAEVDREGNVNVSRFGGHAPGCGGFIDITQSAKRLYFCGAFTGGGTIDVADGGLSIRKEGRFRKFVDRVAQVTFSGPYSLRQGIRVCYLTERAVFTLTPEGLQLTEVAPGIDMERDVLGMMGFRPLVAENLREMPRKLFMEGLMGLREQMGV